ncbi:hypothetical protein EUGRSUZ_A00386 [Eucalyptus grandis]|uniref:Uncharacterized protein n=2 Tax=Eucalyptus grandis TaxID=71139 RepID=A0ACC3M0C8_EUCGR|nr:hypothetical protein EUGRSUZ_A00386 [Eucalyptus grandis]
MHLLGGDARFFSPLFLLRPAKSPNRSLPFLASCLRPAAESWLPCSVQSPAAGREALARPTPPPSSAGERSRQVRL